MFSPRQSIPPQRDTSMKVLTIFLFGFLFLAGGSSGFVSAQENDKLVTSDGKPFEVEKGWTLLATRRGENKRVYIVYTYKTDSVVKFAPHSFRFVVKIKEYIAPDVDYSLLFWELRCIGNQARIPRSEMWLKKRDVSGADIIARSEAESRFEKVNPIFSAVISKPICKQYDKP